MEAGGISDSARDRSSKSVNASSGSDAGFSIEQLVHFLSLLGQDIEMIAIKLLGDLQGEQSERDGPRHTRFPLETCSFSNRGRGTVSNQPVEEF